MNVTCPECSTVYRLPDEKVKSGAKLRCSRCRHVFALTDAVQQVQKDEFLSLDSGVGRKTEDEGLAFAGFDAPSVGAQGESLSLSKPEGAYASLDGLSFDDRTEKDGQAGQSNGEKNVGTGSLEMPEQRRSGSSVFLSFILFATIGGAGWWAWQNTPYLDGVKAVVMPYVAQYLPEVAEQVSLVDQLELRDVRQYQVKNPKLGSLIIIEGKVKNNFSAPRGLIRLEADLFDSQGQKLATQTQLAGVSISSFQLELLDKPELENALNSRLDIVTSNFEVAPAGEVPFTIVFTELPKGATDYTVRIVEAVKPIQAGALFE